jgi:hypothetical protein
MPTMAESMEMQATPERVWEVIGSFGSIADWHPGIESSPVVDGVRYLTLVGGGDVEESLIEHSDAERFYVYAIIKGPFAMTAYRSRIAVRPAGAGSRVDWTGEFEPNDPADGEAIAGIFTQVYKAGLAQIRDMAETA